MRDRVLTILVPTAVVLELLNLSSCDVAFPFLGDFDLRRIDGRRLVDRYPVS